jgi:hypothetical protein
MKAKAPPQLRLRTTIFVGLALILAWLVVSRSVAAYLADAAPHAALWLSPRQPEALVTLADRSLNSSQDAVPLGLDEENQSLEARKNLANSPRNNGERVPAYSQRLDQAFSRIDQDRSVDLATLSDWAKAALTGGPLNARALRILGQLADIAKNNAGALKFMRAAAHLSLHEATAVYWLMLKSAEAKDYKTAIYYADALLRTEPRFSVYVVPIMARMMEEGESNKLLILALAGNPPWRKSFFAALPNNVTDARAPLDLLLALRTSSAPPTSEEFKPYLEFLIAHKFYDTAYYTWLQFLPPDKLRSAGLLFNGSFEAAPSGLPFDWLITPGSGVTIDIVPRSDKDGGHALLVDFQYGRVDYHSVTQLIMLTPGTYEFKTKYQGQLIGPRGLKWRIVCADKVTSPVGESPMINGIASAWRDVAFKFTIPSADCRAQYVRLDLDARMASEQIISGSMLFDELQIQRAASLRADGTRAD